MKREKMQAENLAAVHTHTHTHTHGHSKERGITLIALVVTIVVLLILAGISLSMVLGNNGIITKAKESRTETRMAQIDELVNLAIGDAYTDGIGSITDSGLKSALNNRIGEGTYDISGDETTGWQVTVKETGKTYDIAANGEKTSSVDWNEILKKANENPESFKHGEQSENNKNIGIGTDGEPVNLDLWRYEQIMGKNEIVLSKGEGSRILSGYMNQNIKNGKIQGKIPEYIKLAEEDEFFKVTSMRYTFAYCEDLEEMQEDIPSGVTNYDNTFMQCMKLSKVTIPRVSSIGYNNLSGAFNGCNNITTIIIPETVEEIDSQFFFGWGSLKAIDVDTKNQYYSSEDGILFDKQKKAIIIYPAGKTERNYDIKNGITEIKIGAFSWCENLEKVTIPNSISELPEGVFANCINLTSIIIPESVTSIGYYALGGTSLTSIIIPEGVDNIESGAFYDCRLLKSIDVNEKNKYYSSEDGILFDKEKKNIITYPAGKTERNYDIKNGITEIKMGAFSGCENLETITIPNSISELPEGTFSYCTNLTSITIPDSVTLIGGYAFSECTSLTSITIPDSVTSIGDNAFHCCESLKSIVIPSKVSIIDAWAFSYCDALTDVYFEETTAPTLKNGSFTKYYGVKTTFHFKNQAVYDAFTEDYYNTDYGEKSTDFNW